MKSQYTILLFYKYTDIKDPQLLQQDQKLLCERLGLKGRIIIAKEGINSTLEGTTENTEKYLTDLLSHKEFSDINIKKSEGTGNAFPKLSVRVRPEIVATHLEEKDIDPNVTTGKYIKAEELRQWFLEGKEFYIVDMRNDFEQVVGMFRNSFKSGMGYFRDLPKVLSSLDHLRDKTILTVCTGGVRCEKASGFLVANGFSDVYQLYGGIVTYMEKYPGEDFIGSLYVFDNRLVMGFNMSDPNRIILGKCVVCNNPSEHFINCRDGFCHRHFIVCEECLKGEEAMLCPIGCRDYTKEHPELKDKQINKYTNNPTNQ